MDNLSKLEGLMDQYRPTPSQSTPVTTTNNSWYSGSVPTQREFYAQLYKINQVDPERARSLEAQYNQRRADPTSIFYRPYSQATNQAESNLRSLGFDTSVLSKDYINQNQGWIESNLERRSGTGNTPSTPTKKSSINQKIAFELYQWKLAEDYTQAAEAERQGAIDYVKYWAGRKDLNLSADQIIEKYKKEYAPDHSKTLNDMQDKYKKDRFKLPELNRGVELNDDVLYGAIWEAWNPEYNGNIEGAMVYSYLGEGNTWQDDAKKREMLSPLLEDGKTINPNFKPYAVSSTNLDSEAYLFGVDSFPKGWTQSHYYYKVNGTPEEQKAFEHVEAAESDTLDAEKAVLALNGWIDQYISKSDDYNEAIGKLERLFKRGKIPFTNADGTREEVDLSILKKMDASMGMNGEAPTTKLLAMTRSVDYKYSDIVKRIQGICLKNSSNAVSNGSKFLDYTSKKWFGDISVAGAIRGERPKEKRADDQEGYYQSPIDTAVKESKNKRLRRKSSIYEDNATTSEQEYVDNAWDVTYDDVKNRAGEAQTWANSSDENRAAIVDAGTKDVMVGYTNDVFGSIATVFDYERDLSQKGYIESQIKELEPIMAEQGQTTPLDHEDIVTYEGKEYKVTTSYDFNLDQYVISNITDMEGNPPADDWTKSYVELEAYGNDAIWDRNEEEAFEYSQAVKDQPLSEEGKQYRALQIQLEDLNAKIDKNKDKYEESKKLYDAAQDKYNQQYYLMTESGLDTSEMEVLDLVLAYMMPFADYEATVWSEYNPSNSYFNALSAGFAREEVYKKAEETNNEVLKELENATAVKQYLADLGIKIPDNYMKNLDRHIAKLEKDVQDYEFFMLSKNDDFKELAQKGRNMEFEGRPLQNFGLWNTIFGTDPRSKWTQEEYYKDLAESEWDMQDGPYATYGLRGVANAFTNQLTEDEKDIYYYLMAKGEKKKAQEYISSLFDVLQTRGTNAIRERVHDQMTTTRYKDFNSMEEVEEWAKQNPNKEYSVKSNGGSGYQVTYEDTDVGGVIGQNLEAVFLSPSAGMMSLGYGLYNLITGEEYNPDSTWLGFNNFRSDVRAETAQRFIDDFGEGTLKQKVAQFFYEMISNRLDSAMNVATFGGGEGILREIVGAIPMGLSAAADAMSEAKRRGASDSQAWWIGGVTLVCETVTEGVSMDNIKSAFKIGKEITVDSAKSWALNWLKHAGISEMLGESINQIAENFADEIVMGDKSEHAQLVYQYRMQGMTETEAEWAARMDEVKGVMRTAVMSYLSPGLDIASYTAGRAGHYINQVQNRLSTHKGENVADAIKGLHEEKKTAKENAAKAEAEQQAFLNEDTANGEGAFNLDAPTTLKGKELAQKVQERVEKIKERHKNDNSNNAMADWEILETASQSDSSTQTASIAAVLDVEGTETSKDIANAAAVKLKGMFDNAVSWIQGIFTGTSVDNIKLDEVKKGIRYAALGGAETYSGRMIQSEEFKNAAPNQQAKMLATTAYADEKANSASDTINNTVYENRIAEAEKTISTADEDAMIEGLEGNVDEESVNAYTAEQELEDRMSALREAANKVTDAMTEFLADPSQENKNRLNKAQDKLAAADAVAKEYEQSNQKAQQKLQKSVKALQDAKEEKLTKLREGAAQMVADVDAQRAAEAERVQAEQKAAEEAAQQEKLRQEEIAKAAQEMENFTRLNAQSLADKLFPNVSKEDKRTAVLKIMQLQRQMSKSVDSVESRKAFTESLAKTFNLEYEIVGDEKHVPIFNARIDPGTGKLQVSFLAKQSDQLYAVLVHEITHTGEGNGNEVTSLYKELADMAIKTKYGDDFSYQGIIDAMNKGDISSQLAQDILAKKKIYDNALKDELAKKGKNGHSYEEILQEIIADRVGEVIAGDAEALKYLATKPTLARRILAAITSFLNKCRGIEGEPITQAMEFAKKLKEAIDYSQSQAKASKVKHSINEDYMNAVESGDMETAQRLVDEKASEYLNEQLLPDDSDEVGFKYHRGPAPTKTFKRYAVLNVSPEGFKAAYAGNKNATPVGVWLDAQNLQSYLSDKVQFKDGSFATYIPGDTGESAKKRFSADLLEEYGLKPSQSMLLERGGKHSSDVPNFSQMNLGQDENGNKVTNLKRDGALPHNKLIFEIEYGISDNGDLTEYVKKNGRIDKSGKNQGIAKIEPNQYYDFKTNPNAVGNWGIGGTFRITRLVPYDEIVSATKQYKDDAISDAKARYEAGEISKDDMNKIIKNAESIQLQKWVGGYHPEDFGLTVENVDEMYANGLKMKLTDPVTYDDNGNVIPLSERFNSEKEDFRYSISDATPMEDEDGNEIGTNLPGGTFAMDTQKYSLNSFDLEEQERTRKALRDAKDEFGERLYTDEQIDKYMTDALSIASMIAADKIRLDFNANEHLKFLKKNQDYYFTLDASTLCAKRLLYQGTFDAVQHAMPNEVFMPDDLIDLVNIMRDMGYETPCGICYVESRRRWLDKYANEWLQNYDGPGKEDINLEHLSTSDGLEELRLTNKAAYDSFMEAMSNKGSANPKVVQLRTEYKGDIYALTPKQIQDVKDIGGLRIQSFSDFETPHLLDMIQAVYDMASVGLTSQAYTKVPNFAWVFGDTGIKINLSLIGKGTGVDENGNLIFDDVEGMNHDEAFKLRERYGQNVGTILVGMNDEHIIAAMGDPRIDFIIPFHRSGWSQGELSRISVLNGYSDYTSTQNERIILGRVSKVLKEWNSKDKGKKAMEKWIAENGEEYEGYRIEETEKGYRIVFDGYKTESFQKHKERTGESLSNFEPVGANKYWDFNMSGEWNARNYLEMCAKAGRTPKFYQFLVDNGDGSFSLPEGTDKRSTAIREGYWKTLIDFKMYENDSYGRNGGAVVGAPQREVTPNVNMNEAYRVMNEYKPGRQQPNGQFIEMQDNNSLPKADPAIEAFKEYLPMKRARQRELAEQREAERKAQEAKGIVVKAESDQKRDARIAREGKEIYQQYSGRVFGAYTGQETIGSESAEEEYIPKQKQLAIDAETGETVEWKNSIDEQALDDWFDSYIENMSAEELDELAQEMFGISLKNPSEKNPSEEPVNETVPEQKPEPKDEFVGNIHEAYLNAINNGDMDTARKIIDHLAKKAGYTVKGTHRTNAEFTVFDRSKQSGKNGKSLGDGFYVAAGEGTEYDNENYGKKRMLVYIKPGKTLDIQNSNLSEQQANDVYDKYFAPYHSDAANEADSPYRIHVIKQLQNEYHLMDYIKEAAENANTTTDEVFKWLGYNSIKDGPQYCVFDPEQIKSADPITYNDQNEMIGSEERFNEGEPDYRYSLPDGTLANAAYIPNGVKDNGEEVDFIDEMMNTRRKKFETRRTRNLRLDDEGWTGVTRGGKNGQVVGRIRFGEPVRFQRYDANGNETDIYRDSLINGTRSRDGKRSYDMEAGETKWGYPVLDVENFGENTRPVIENRPSGAKYKYSLPSDAPYLSAVDHGDMETAQRLVDEKAKENGYDVEYAVWRGDFEPYNELEPGVQGGNLGSGLYFTPDRYYAEKFASRNSPVRKFYLKMGNNFNYDAFTQQFNDYAMNWIEESDMYAGSIADIDEYTWSMIWDDFISENGYDSVTATGVGGLSNGAKETQVQNSWQAKLADPVTYDDQGNVIPLSERFNTQKEDIRYSLPSDDVLQQMIQQSLMTNNTEVDNEAFAAPLEGQNPLMTKSEGPALRQSSSRTLQMSDELDQRAKDYIAKRAAYFPDTNADQISRAIQWIRNNKSSPESDGFSESVKAVTSQNFDYRSADGQARILAVMAMAAARGDTIAQTELADAYARQGTDLARALQARKIFFLMTPEGRKQSLNKMMDEVKQKLGAKGINTDNMKFSAWIDDMVAVAETEADFRKVRKAAAEEIADQMPANWKDRLRSLRMLAMLGNPRTHVRNFMGNLLFVPVVGIKNKIAAAMELTKPEGMRTKTTSLTLDSDIKAFAKQDAKNMKDILTGESKYNELNPVDKEFKAFKGWLQRLMDFNSDMLEKEDWFFLKGHYTRALGGWMQANGYTAADMQQNSELLEQGRAYAVLEAQKATYRDFNEVAKRLNDFTRNPKTLWGKGGALLVESLVPFKKTPLNILSRGLEYSPVGLIKSFTYDLRHLNQYKQYMNGELKVMPENAISPNQWIDKFASGLTGTGIMAIGALMSKLGLVTCGVLDDDDPEKEKGQQKFAIKILGTDFTYTIDWAAPESIPFFVGVALMQERDDAMTWEDFLNVATEIGEPVFNLSMLDGISDVFKTSKFDDTNVPSQILMKIATNYVSSYYPSVFGAATRTFFDNTQRRSYVPSDETKGPAGTIKYAWESLKNKIPFASNTSIPVRDLWGNEKTHSFLEGLFENFISPGYIEETKNDPILNEFCRLYEARVQDSDKIMPGNPPKSHNGYAFSAEEYDKLWETRGRTAFNLLNQLLKTSEYQDADDAKKVQMINSVWDYAKKAGLAAVVKNYDFDDLGDQAATELAHKGKVTGYKSDMFKCLEDKDLDGFDTMLEALYREEVEDSQIKEWIGDKYRPLYQKAYKRGDKDEMLRIQELLDNTQYYFDTIGWEEKVDEKR